MKVISLILLLGLFGHSFAQTTFFIRPTVHTKSFIGSAANELTSDGKFFDNKFSKNPYFEVDNQIFAIRPIIHIGLNLGLSLEGAKHFF